MKKLELESLVWELNLESMRMVLFEVEIDVGVLFLEYLLGFLLRKPLCL